MHIPWMNTLVSVYPSDNLGLPLHMAVYFGICQMAYDTYVQSQVWNLQMSVNPSMCCNNEILLESVIICGDFNG